MEINLTGHHIEITDAIRTFATERLERLTHHFPGILTTHLTLTVEKQTHTAEADLHVKGHTFHASVDTDDMYKSIDVLYDKLKRIVDKYKEKLKEH